MKLENYQPKINRKNRFYYEKVLELASQYEIIGVVNVDNLPAPQFQEIRTKLRGRAEILIVKKNIMELAFKDLEEKFPGISQLLDKASGICGLVFTNESPFRLYKFVQKSKSPAPAKAGQVTPKDIVVPAGPTGLAPGPIIGELGSLKIKAGIEGGKVAVKEDAVPAKEGEVITEKLSEILARLGIKPMEVGLDIKGAYDDGVIYGKDILEVDESHYLEQVAKAAAETTALTIGLEYYTEYNMAYFLGTAQRDSLGLGVGLEYMTDETRSLILAKAYNQGLGVASQLPEDAQPEEVKKAASVAPSPDVASDDSNESKEDSSSEEESEEEDASSGLGSLFG